MKNHVSSELFFKMMVLAGKTDKIITPPYVDFIQALFIIFDLNKEGEKGTRPREMSESRSMSRRQTIYDVALEKVFSICKVKREDYDFLKTCFLKIENILAYFKSTTIYSPKSRAYGEICFYRLVALPQILEFLRFSGNELGIKFASELLHYLELVTQPEKREMDCIKRLKGELTELLDGLECTDFRIEVGKMDGRSFPKVQTIEEALVGLGTDIHEFVEETKANEIVLLARSKLLAAKVAFKILKALSKNKCEVTYPDMEYLQENHRELCQRYVCNPELNEGCDDFVRNEDFRTICCTYLESIGHVDDSNIPAEVARYPETLIQYRNHAFLPLCVLKKFVWDLERRRVNESYIKKFETAFLFTTKKYQYGQIGSQIAGILLAMKIQKSASIPPQSLEPLVMALMENRAISDDFSLLCETPFGPEVPGRPYTSDFNVAKAIFKFNRCVKGKEIEEALCNPLKGLDQILQHIFDKLDKGDFFDTGDPLPRSLMKINPVKGFSICLYDALKNINSLLNQFNLIELVPEKRYALRAKTSCAGEYINRYLLLENSEQIEILKKIDPEECSKDQLEAR